MIYEGMQYRTQKYVKERLKILRYNEPRIEFGWERYTHLVFDMPQIRLSLVDEEKWENWKIYIINYLVKDKGFDRTQIDLTLRLGFMGIKITFLSKGSDKGFSEGQGFWLVN